MQSDESSTHALNFRQDIRIRRRLILAWFALAWERLWTRLWVTAALIGLFVAVVLTDLLPALPLAIHILVLLAAAGGIAYVTSRHLKGFAWPSHGEARVRLARALRLAVGRHNGASEAKARGLGKAARHVANMANFAAQTNFAAHH